MQTANAELMRSAREALRGKWGLAVGVTVVYLVIVVALQNVKQVGPIASILVSGPFAGGLALFYLSIARGTEAKFEQLFDGFRTYATNLLAYILMTVFILLWMLLLIVPGVIAAISYSMTYFVIADTPGISAMDALKQSKQMMNGNKGKYVGLMFRFFGWSLLAILSCGIGFLWLMPYMQTAAAAFYEDLKKNAGETYLATGASDAVSDSETKSEDAQEVLNTESAGE